MIYDISPHLTVDSDAFQTCDSVVEKAKVKMKAKDKSTSRASTAMLVSKN